MIPLYFSRTAFRNSAINSSHTADPKMHHPATDSSVLSLQCGKATAVFVLSKDCDIVAQVSKCSFKGLDVTFPAL